MEGDEEFDLEKKLEELSLDSSTSGGGTDPADRDLQLAQLIARVTADLPSTVCNENSEANHDSAENNSEQPKSLIVTNLPQKLFSDQEMKAEFEVLFRSFDETAIFHYLKSFRRARVDLSTPELATKAQLHLHRTPFGETLMNCFFGHPPLVSKNSRFLELPPPVRQFLISPPASPPVDWAPGAETEPVVNFDLLAAIAKLGPGDEHELHPPSGSQPGIVVRICEDQESPTGSGKVRITQTQCPQRN